MSVTVDPSPARLSDEPTLTLEIAYAQGITVHKPEFGSALGEFVIRDFREPLPRVEGDRQILQQIYTLEPTRAGKIVIDPISITFTDDRAGGDGKEHTLQTEPITVEVAAAVAQEAPSLDQLHGPAEPLPLPQSSRAAWWWIGLAGSGCAACGGGLVVAPPEEDTVAPLPTPAELAKLELRRLRESDLAGRDVKLFYVELTAIVRRYIERTKGIHAPEQTTQEFLQEISRRKRLSRRAVAPAAEFSGGRRPGQVRRPSTARGRRRGELPPRRRHSWAAPARGGGRMNFRFQDAVLAAVAGGAGRDRRAGDPPAAPRGGAVFRREHPADAARHAGLADQAGAALGPPAGVGAGDRGPGPAATRDRGVPPAHRGNRHPDVHRPQRLDGRAWTSISMASRSIAWT